MLLIHTYLPCQNAVSSSWFQQNIGGVLYLGLKSTTTITVLDNPDQNFPQIPQGLVVIIFVVLGSLSVNIKHYVSNNLKCIFFLWIYFIGKYYLVDKGYLNTEGFIAPYQGVRYQHYEFRGANQLPRNAKELFNHRHCFLRNAILRSFNVLKTRFPILKLAPQYSFQIQRDIVIAGCVLHNFIRREERNDWIFNSVGGSPVEEISDIDELPDVPMLSSIQEQLAFSSRDSIASSMWDDFLTKWDEWWLLAEEVS